MSKELKQTPEERAETDYKKGMFKSPYAPGSKADKRYKETQECRSLDELASEGAFDDGGQV